MHKLVNHSRGPRRTVFKSIQPQRLKSIQTTQHPLLRSRLHLLTRSRIMTSLAADAENFVANTLSTLQNRNPTPCAAVTLSLGSWCHGTLGSRTLDTLNATRAVYDH